MNRLLICAAGILLVCISVAAAAGCRRSASGRLAPTTAIAVMRIHQVQGTGAASPLTDSVVVVEGVATAVFQDASQLRGFFVQEEDVQADIDANSSEGVLVFCGACPVRVTEGNRVRIAGTVAEFLTMTQIMA